MSGDFFVAGWRVQPAANRLRQGDAVVRLEPKVMQVLVCLAEQAGEVVTREALIARVWPDVFVTDDVLHRAVRELRRVFGDSSSAPRYIETIRKRGYRLMVTPAAEAPEVTPLSSAPPPVLTPPQSGSWPMPALAAALVLLLAVAIVGLSLRKDTVTEAQARFVPLVSGPSNESDPAVSPDGVRLAYVVRDTANDQADIYLQTRPGVSPERLTDDPADDRLPAWSPDGRRLAFVRMGNGQCAILVRSLDAASEQRIARCANSNEPRLRGCSTANRWSCQSLRRGRMVHRVSHGWRWRVVRSRRLRTRPPNRLAITRRRSRPTAAASPSSAIRPEAPLTCSSCRRAAAPRVA